MVKKIKKGLILLLVMIFILSPTYSFAAGSGNSSSLVIQSATDHSKIHSKVKESLDKDEYAEILVQLTEKVDTKKAAKEAKEKVPKGTTPYNKKMIGRRAVVDSLKSTSERSQKGILDYLAKEKDKGNVKEYNSYYIVNAAYAKANRKVVEELSKRTDVEMIYPNELVPLEWPEVSPNSINVIPDENIEWGVKKVQAPDVWNTFGFDGTGVVVGLIDTGVDYLHPALFTKWRGYNPANPSQPNTTFNWYDPVNNSPLPRDMSSMPHGSHVMGSILGSDPNNQHVIGVAPGAKFIVANGFSEMGGYDDDLIACGEWMLAPKDANGTPHPEMAPDVINNSWGGSAGFVNDFYRQVVQAWRSADIVPVFAAGNDGPGEQTVSCPGAYPEAIAVGAIDINNVLANFSSRGPGLYNDEIQKPNVCAPGVNITSSIPDESGGHIYEGGWSGTSMATPHVTGVVALMLSADASLTCDRVEDILITSATPLKDANYTSVPNYGYGYGLVNAFDAVASVASGIGTVTGKVVMDAQDTELPKIVHTPYEYTFANEDTPIFAHVSDNVFPTKVELWVKTATGDMKIDMEKTADFVKEGNYKAVIPGQYVKDPSLKYQIKVYDFGGNLTQTPEYEVPTKFGIIPGQYKTNFSTYPIGWKMNGDWEWGKATVGIPSPYGDYRLATNLDGMYKETTKNVLISPPIDLRNASNASIIINHWYAFGKDSLSSDHDDHGTLNISTDGVHWTRIVGFPGVRDNRWEKTTVDLSQYSGQKVYISFAFLGDSDTKNLGWHIGQVNLVSGNQLGELNTNENINNMPSNTLEVTTGIPIDAVVTVLETGRTIHTNPYDGSYSIKLMPDTYTFRAEAYGYKTMDKTISIAGDQQLVTDFSLIPKGKGSISGTIVDSITGAKLAGVLVKVIEDANVTAVTTDQNGQFVIDDVYEGNYTLRVNLQGYIPLDTPIIVTPNQTANYNTALQPFVTASSSEIAYEDGYSDTSHTFVNPGYGWAVRMTPASFGLVKGIKAYTIDNYLYPGGSDFKVALVDIKPDGKPGETMAMTDAITFTVGTWTYVDLSKYNFCTDKDFYAVIIQVNPANYAAAIGIDIQNGCGRSYIYYPDGSFAPYKVLDAHDGNLLIRSEMDYCAKAPIVISPVINSPVNGAIVKGTVTIDAIVNSNVTINRVECFVDGSLIGTDSESPYNCDWDTTKAANGNHNIQVKAYDAAGNVGASDVVTVSVDNSVPDTTAPACSITSPVNGATVKGLTAIAADASDNVGVVKVECFVDGSLIGTDSQSPYNFDWDTTKTANGGHNIQVKAYDAAGNVGASDVITVSVDNSVPDTTAPACSITSPVNGATVKGLTAIAADASDNVGVVKVECFVDGSLIGTDSQSPYNFDWDTTKAANGNHNIQVKAYDAAGNVGASDVITVSVDNSVPDTTAPACSITAPTNGTTVKGLTAIAADASDNVGVVKVEFFVDGSLIGTDSESPYNFD